jgi:glycosyltransferase involved in cell wall biosynthesis
MGMTSVENPLVSIGVPVFNAERYLRAALDSLIAQTYPNLEIVIADDASSDQTQLICEEYAGKDQRIRYVRNRANLGAAANFNRTFELSHGEFFMWAAFDDLRHPEYVSRCTTALVRAPSAVMCCTDVSIIDEDGSQFSEGSYVTKRPAGPCVTQRIDAVTSVTNWVDVYSLIRRSSLARTRGLLPIFGGDVVLIMELCLEGPVISIPEVLWSARIIRSKTASAQVQTLAPTSSNRAIPVSYSDLACNLLGAIAASRLSWPVRWKMSIRSLFNTCGHNVNFRDSILCDASKPISRSVNDRRFADTARLLVIRTMAMCFEKLARQIRRARQPLRTLYRRVVS